MKNFRSSVNLKTISNPNMDQSALRQKIKKLQEQIQMLSQSNLNILMPISEHNNNKINYDAIIAKLKTQILIRQQQIKNNKNLIKKMEKQKQVVKMAHQNQISLFKQKIINLQEEYNEITIRLQQNEEQLRNQIQQHDLTKNKLIQNIVQLKFMRQDMIKFQEKYKKLENKYNNLEKCIKAVKYYTRIYHSQNLPITAISDEQLRQSNQYIRQLEKKIENFCKNDQKKIINLGLHQNNVGQEIVRLKKNLDLQLGLQVQSSHSQAFLKHYNETNEMFKDLIQQCHQQ